MKDNNENEILKIYGFGSYFNGAKNFNDIDFLIIHPTINKPSCLAAIECKALLLKKIMKSHISILSIKENESIHFIKKSNAYLLGEINVSNMEADLNKIVDAIVRNIN
ncbi:hypothetical protein [Acinetobacter sp. CFCC 10889]|uniref:hypothetical protein n=1 Tax=Acinetobacter sp. CFCC 10889 TaxID=1775557 RepID=UPI000DD00762|nr:hypothetical protein [Acinetobacter sp. CFCC 10889]